MVHDPLADTDGVATRLYHYLWRKNAAGRTPTEFRIPDTVRMRLSRLRLRVCASELTRSRARQVVYKYRLPAFWFFSSAQNGQARRGAAASAWQAPRAARLEPSPERAAWRGRAQIMKKKQLNVAAKNIIESFTKKKARAARFPASPAAH